MQTWCPGPSTPASSSRRRGRSCSSTWTAPRRPAAACAPVGVAGRVGELKRLWVEPEHRNKGLARQLLACLEARAVELGYERLYLHTGPLQAAAMRLYESSGFRSIPNYGTNAASTFLHSYEKVLTAPA